MEAGGISRNVTISTQPFEYDRFGVRIEAGQSVTISFLEPLTVMTTPTLPLAGGTR